MSVNTGQLRKLYKPMRNAIMASTICVLCDELDQARFDLDAHKEELTLANARIAELERENSALKEALLLTARVCQCGDLAKYDWSDEDGEEYCCEKHKNQHFFTYGPRKIESYETIKTGWDLAKTQEADNG